MSESPTIVTIDEWRATHARVTNDELVAMVAASRKPTAFVDVTGSDTRIDQRDNGRPLNGLPVRCGGCGFPDLDHVPRPYFLIRSRTKSTNEMALARVGNFLLRDRARRVLELACPGQCDFHRTAYEKSDEATEWWLAVPRTIPYPVHVAQRIRRCAVCGEPASFHRGSEYDIAESWM